MSKRRAERLNDRDFHLRLSALHRQLANVHQQWAAAKGRNERGSPVSGPARVRDMQVQILELLTAHPGLTTADIVDALFSTAYGITREHFARRVAVAVSHMHRRLKTIVIADGYASARRPLKWAVRRPK